MTLIMEGLFEEDFGRDTEVGDSSSPAEGAVVLRQSGWSASVCCVGQNYNTFGGGNKLTFTTNSSQTIPTYCSLFR